MKINIIADFVAAGTEKKENVSNNIIDNLTLTEFPLHDKLTVREIPVGDIGRATKPHDQG